MSRLKVFTWHVHGSYLHYLSHVPHELYLPVRPDRAEGYGGRGHTFTWPDTVHEVPVERVPDLDLDVVVTQSRRNWEVDRHEVLSAAQRRLPRIHVEHDPPRQSPTDERHFVDDPGVVLVHVTPFNALMWDSGPNRVRVIDHGVAVPPDAVWTGELDRGVVVVNNLGTRGRRLGPDVFEQVRDRVPLDLVGMGSDRYGGLGDIPRASLFHVVARYRFLFNPIRWTSLGLGVCEAMAVGLPVVGLATTELATAVENGVSGYVDTDVDALVRHMQRLLSDRDEAARLSKGARERARTRFGLDRFVSDWSDLLESVAARP